KSLAGLTYHELQEKGVTGKGGVRGTLQPRNQSGPLFASSAKGGSTLSSVEMICPQPVHGAPPPLPVPTGSPSSGPVTSYSLLRN
ncbi:unnamed protein product, partial [Amoebophrya sp. A25]